MPSHAVFFKKNHFPCFSFSVFLCFFYSSFFFFSDAKKSKTRRKVPVVKLTIFLCDNIVVMWIVLIRENVTAGVSGRKDKGTEKRLEMMWCQHGCHSCKEQEVYNAVRTTQLHTVTTETIDTPFTPKDS